MTLEVRGLSKAFAGMPALNDISLALEPGVTVLLGPNGSGKTTLLRLLAGITRPDAGVIALAGCHVDSEERAYHAQIGYLPQDFAFAPGQTARGFLRYIGSLKGLPRSVCDRQVVALLTLTGLDEDADRPLLDLSGGQRRRAGLAQALLGAPRLLFLDEPTSGLDPEERQRILTLLTALGQERAILVSTHIAGDAEALGANLLILQAGRIVFSGRTQALIDSAVGRVWEVKMAVGAADIDALAAGGRVSQVAVSDGLVRLRYVGEPPAGLAVTPVRPALEDAYLLHVDAGMSLL